VRFANTPKAQFYRHLLQSPVSLYKTTVFQWGQHRRISSTRRKTRIANYARPGLEFKSGATTGRMAGKGFKHLRYRYL